VIENAEDIKDGGLNNEALKGTFCDVAEIEKFTLLLVSPSFLPW
jgi:hypothetical protein